ncbi:MAG: response regulator [Deltaproteobacteria bacterium]|nr:response regulator [Deltaproteobacteria bacterium]MBW2016072.1 response regulator [Deltaproteobacteria bacterium]MBW2130469.1 response regulator [Deltaproteobacteria bacterium]MBW2305099.1 response regulator [Deltaproteobacteria bacterium]
MQADDILEGKKVLVVDDEPDVLETIEDMLSMCLIDSAPSFETAKKFLDKNTYDLCIFDIMGVNGYELLRIATQKGIPVLMLTAHALSPDNLVRSIKEGAHSYVPKDKLPEISVYVRDILEEQEKGEGKKGRWFARLKPFFDKQFGEGWKEKDRAFWKDFESRVIVTKEDVEKIL